MQNGEWFKEYITDLKRDLKRLEDKIDNIENELKSIQIKNKGFQTKITILVVLLYIILTQSSKVIAFFKGL